MSPVSAGLDKVDNLYTLVQEIFETTSFCDFDRLMFRDNKFLESF